MRIRRSVRRVFGVLVGPAAAAVITIYFGYAMIYGPRGYLALSETQAKLASERTQLRAAEETRQGLEHRMTLLSPGHVDADLVEELARTQLMDGAPGQVAVPRDGH